MRDKKLRFKFIPGNESKSAVINYGVGCFLFSLI